MKKKFTIFTEDYNIPPHPWIIWNEIFGKETFLMTAKQIMVDDLFVFEQDKVTWGPDKKQFMAAGDYFNKKMKQEPEFVKVIMQKQLQAFKEIELFCRKILAVDLKKCSDKALLAWYEKYYRLWVFGGIYGVIPQYMEMSDNRFSDEVKNRIKTKIKKFGDQELVFSRLTTSLKKTYLYKEKTAIIKLLINWHKDKNKWKIFLTSKKLEDLPTNMRAGLKSLVKAYGFMQFYYDGQPANELYYFSVLKRTKTNPEKEIIRDNQERKNLKNWQNKVFSCLDIEDRKQVLFLQDFAFLKELRKEVHIYRLNHAMHSWFKEAARRLLSTPTLAKYLLPAEIRRWLSGGRKPAPEKLSERYQCSAWVLVNGKEKVFSGLAAKKIKSMFINNEIKTSSALEIKGNIAYPGQAEGIVKIVNSLKDLAKFQEGDILVSFSTNPSLVPAMNKAAAIITNTGGVTCHAAIVSRELKIPCIIGTKIATQVLHDGDKVKVDANRGIIKIIK